MAAINLQNVEMQNDGQSIRVIGLSTLGFTSTEVGLDVGFNVAWTVNGIQAAYGLSQLLHNYYDDYHRIEYAKTTITGGAIVKVAATRYEEVFPEGRFTVELPFEFVIDLAEWLNLIDARFGDLPALAAEIKERLRVIVKANLSPNIYGGAANCIFPQIDSSPEWSESNVNE